MTEVYFPSSTGSYYYSNYSPYAYYPEEELTPAESRVEVYSGQPALEDQTQPPTVGEGLLAGALGGTPLACGARTGLYVDEMWIEDEDDGGVPPADAADESTADASDVTFDFSDVSEIGMDADADSMPDEVPPDVHEVGDEGIIDVTEDTSDYLDTSETEETCERTCEPGPCSDILNVPDDYPTVYDAMEVAQRGDVVNLAPGTFTLDHTVQMGECTHLQGAGVDSTTVVQFPCIDTPPPSEWNIEMAEGSSVSGINFTFEGESGGCGILIKDISVEVESCQIYDYISIQIEGNSSASIHNNIFLGGYNEVAVWNDSSAEISENSFSNYAYGVVARDNADATLRRNTFTRSENMYSVSLGDNATIDLGRADDPGLNRIYGSLLYSDAVYPPGDPDCSGWIPWRILNGTPETVEARGNCFDVEPTVCPPGIITFEEMTALPDPFDPGSNITHIIDSHDEGCEYGGVPCGTVDYRDFRSVSDCE